MANDDAPPKPAAPAQGSPPELPSWFPIVGVAFAGGFVVFLMLFISFGSGVTEGTRGLWSLLFGLIAGLAASFLGGKIAAVFHIPLPWLESDPIKASATGGVATMLVAMALAYWLLPAPPTVPPVVPPTVPPLQNAAATKAGGEFEVTLRVWTQRPAKVPAGYEFRIQVADNADMTAPFYVSEPVGPGTKDVIPLGFAAPPSPALFVRGVVVSSSNGGLLSAGPVFKPPVPNPHAR